MLTKVINSTRSLTKNNPKLLIDTIRDVAKTMQTSGEKITPSSLYKNTLQSSNIKTDDHQLKAISELDQLFQKIESLGSRQKSSYKEEESEKPPEMTLKEKFTKIAYEKLFVDKEMKQLEEVWRVRRMHHHHWAEAMQKDPELEDPAIKGLYLFGDVGCGKTMMMDLFHTCFTHSNKADMVKRIHFNKFMLDFHKRIQTIKDEHFNETGEHKSDIVPELAKRIGEETWILCFDEFQIVDVADAMILKHLFTELWLQGVVVVFTGNRKPKDLYKDGLMYRVDDNKVNG